jgi:hypothetical protein
MGKKNGGSVNKRGGGFVGSEVEVYMWSSEVEVAWRPLNISLSSAHGGNDFPLLQKTLEII